MSPELLTGWRAAALVLSTVVAICCITVSPWIYGGVQLNVQVLLCAAILIAGMLCGAALLTRRSESQQSGSVVPFVPFLLMMIVGIIQQMPTSLQTSYAAATRLQMAQITMAAGAFAMAAVLFRRHRSRSLMWITLLLNGTTLGFFGIAHKLRPEAGVFGYVPSHGGSPFTSFVSKNSAAGYLNLCVAAGLGLLVWAGSHSFSSRRRRQARSRISNLQLMSGVGITICLAAIFCSLSRSGCVAAVGAGLITAVTMSGRRRMAVTLTSLAICALCLAFVAWSGLGSDVEARLATLSSAEVVENGRVAHWQDAIEASSDYWLAGSGLGSYRYAYLPYQSGIWNLWFHHAENQYVETLLETGVIGLVALAILLVLMSQRLYRLSHQNFFGDSSDIRVAGVYAVSSMVIQSLFDFPLVMPSNMLTFAIICGAVVGAGAAAVTRTSGSHSSRRSFVPIWATGLLLAYGVFGLQELRAAAAVESARDRVPDIVLDTPTADGIDEQLNLCRQHIAELAELAAGRADDATLHRHLAELYVAQYRLLVFRSRLPTLSSSDIDSTTVSALWLSTEPATLYAEANQAWRMKRRNILETMQNNDATSTSLVPAVFHLYSARRACELLPEVNLLLAQLAFLHQEKPTGEEYLNREAWLSNANPEVLYRVGLTAFTGDLNTTAANAWKRCQELDPRYTENVVNFFETRDADISAMLSALPDTSGTLVKLARTRFADTGQARFRLALLEQARRILNARSLRDGQWHAEYAQVYAASNQPQAAIDSSRTATQLEPANPELRYQLATFLQEAGRIEEAREAARACVLLSPDHAKGRALVETLDQLESSGAGNG